MLGGASLAAEAAGVSRALAAGDLDDARRLAPRAVRPDPARLDPAGLARTAVESVAENTCDVIVAPLPWGGAAGALPAWSAYRAVNTLDAMVGHPACATANFGWAAARLDDVANVAPARPTGVLAAACAPVAGGQAAALRVMRTFGPEHPSPNAGHCEAAFAGALGLRCGRYQRVRGRGRKERPQHLGDGRVPLAADIRRAVRLSRAGPGRRGGRGRSRRRAVAVPEPVPGPHRQTTEAHPPPVGAHHKYPIAHRHRLSERPLHEKTAPAERLQDRTGLDGCGRA